MEMNKLDEIIHSKNKVFVPDSPDTLESALVLDDVKEVALEFAKHILDEAAENAKIKMMKKSQYSKNAKWKNADKETEIDLFNYEVKYFVNKQSITNTLNKYL